MTTNRKGKQLVRELKERTGWSYVACQRLRELHPDKTNGEIVALIQRSNALAVKPEARAKVRAAVRIDEGHIRMVQGELTRDADGTVRGSIQSLSISIKGTVEDEPDEIAIGERVEVIAGPRAGRTGTIKRANQTEPEWVYVVLDRAPRERTVKISLLPRSDLRRSGSGGTHGS